MEKDNILKSRFQIMIQKRKGMYHLSRSWNYLEKIIRNMPESEPRSKLLSCIKDAKSWGRIRDLYSVRDNMINIFNIATQENLDKEDRKVVLSQLELIHRTFDVVVYYNDETNRP
jgi:hypothetical protein